MCGICGFIDFNSKSDVAILGEMVATLNHRGPDDSGKEVFIVDNINIGFGHTRLSILDLSSAGHQPMNYEHLSIILNGEIYNFKEIKSELILLGHKFNSDTDTEVILHSFLEWGDICVSKFIGMFVFVVFDKLKNEITIVRDRAGVKPIFYYWTEGIFIFASELKAFHRHPQFKKQINLNSLCQYMDYGYVPSPNCIFQNCYKLDPGHILKLNLKSKEVEVFKYWDVNSYYSLPKLNISYNEALIEVKNLLKSSFEYRMISDVPVGVFLSGGYDSTAVAAILQSGRSNKLKTFSIGFELRNNEAPFAKNIAHFLGTDHSELYCSKFHSQDIILRLPTVYDEPFADSSAIPTILVSELAKKSVTVALSADGADEIFAGYSIYNNFLRSLNLINKFSGSTLKSFGNILKVYSLLPINLRYKNRLELLSKVFKTDKTLIPYHLFNSYSISSIEHNKRLFNFKCQYLNTSFDTKIIHTIDSLSFALAKDYKMYLQNDILTKVDRATMSVSLEGREPFLDHRIVEFVAQLPSHYKFGKTQKMILKDIVHGYVPKVLLDRPKSGFSVPINTWLKNDLYFLVNDYLNPKAISETGFFNSNFVSKILNSFLRGDTDKRAIVWKLIQFQMWYKKWF